MERYFLKPQEVEAIRFRSSDINSVRFFLPKSATIDAEIFGSLELKITK